MFFVCLETLPLKINNTVSNNKTKLIMVRKSKKRVVILLFFSLKFEKKETLR